MASKRKGKEAKTTGAEEATSAPAVTTRVTRSTTRKLTNPDSVSSALPPPPKKTKAASKKQKAASKKQKAAETTSAPVEEKSPVQVKVEKESSYDESGIVVDENDVPAAAVGGKTKEEVGADLAAGKQIKEEDADTAAKKGRTLVIEHCKQCNSFKTRAVQVKNGVESGVPGITVLVNPEKPRRGCFEIREEGGETFISLLDMKRPFTQMKQLDMDKVISDIIEKIK